jgi:hypothetical protein
LGFGDFWRLRGLDNADLLRKLAKKFAGSTADMLAERFSMHEEA